MDLLAQPLGRHPQDVIMVKCQWRYFIQREPTSRSGIITTFHLLYLYQCIIGNGYHSFARITGGIAESIELLDIGILQPCFFTQFAKRALSGRFIHFQEATWEGPFPFVWLYASLDEKHLQPLAIESKYHTVCCNGRMWISVAIFILFHQITPNI